MQLMAFANVYDNEGDHISHEFSRLVKHPPDGYIVVEGNAGLGADWPAAVWKSAQAAALALAVFSAPATINDNWPLWKQIFDQAVIYMEEFHGEFRIDRDSAQIIAMQYAIENYGLDREFLSVHMAIRHFDQGGGGFDDLLSNARVDMDWLGDDESAVAPNASAWLSSVEASRQAMCRYIFGIGDHRRSITLVIERDGSVSFERAIS